MYVLAKGVQGNRNLLNNQANQEAAFLMNVGLIEILESSNLGIAVIMLGALKQATANSEKVSVSLMF